MQLFVPLGVGCEQAPRSSGSELAKIVAGTASPRLLVTGLHIIELPSMSLSQRPHRRVLGFEQLETKTSPTASFVEVAWTADVAAEHARHDTDRLLHYVADTLTCISIERSLPTEAETTAADQLLTTGGVPGG